MIDNKKIDTIKLDIEEKLKKEKVYKFDLELDNNNKKLLIKSLTWEKVWEIDLSQEDNEILKELENNLDIIKNEISTRLSKLRQEIEWWIKLEDIEKLDDDQILKLYSNIDNPDNILLDEAFEKIFIQRLSSNLPAKVDYYINLVKKYESKESYLISQMKIALLLSANDENYIKKIESKLGKDFIKDVLFREIILDDKFVSSYLNIKYSPEVANHIDCRWASMTTCKKVVAFILAIDNTYSNLKWWFNYIKNKNFILNYLSNIVIKVWWNKLNDFFSEFDNRVKEVWKHHSWEVFKNLVKKKWLFWALDSFADIYLPERLWEKWKDLVKIFAIFTVIWTFIYSFFKAKWWMKFLMLVWWLFWAPIWYAALEEYLSKDETPDNWKDMVDKYKPLLGWVNFLKIFLADVKLGELKSFVKDWDVDVDKLLNYLKNKKSPSYQILKKLSKEKIDYMIKCWLVWLGYANWKSGSYKITLLENNISQDKDKKLWKIVSNFYKNKKNKDRFKLSNPLVTPAAAATLDSNRDLKVTQQSEKQLEKKQLQSQQQPEQHEQSGQSDKIKVLSTPRWMVVLPIDKQIHIDNDVEYKITAIDYEKMKEVLKSKVSLEKLSFKEKKIYLVNYVYSIWLSKVNSILNSSEWLINKIQFDKEKLKEKLEIVKDLYQNMLKCSDNICINKYIREIMNTIKESNDTWIVNSTILDDLDSIESILLNFDKTSNIYEAIYKISEKLREWFWDDGASAEVAINLQDLILYDTKFESVKEIKYLKNSLIYLEQAILQNQNKYLKINNWVVIFNKDWLWDFLKWIQNKLNLTDEEVADLNKQLIEAQSVILKQVEKKLDEEIEQLCKNSFDINKCKIEKRNQLEKNIIESYIKGLQALVYYQISTKLFEKAIRDINLDNIKDENVKKLIEQYKDILWIWWFNPSDSNKQFLIELIPDLIISLIPLWSAIAIWRLSYKFFRGISALTKLNKLTTIPKFWRVIGISWRLWAEALWQAAWYNLAENILYDWEDLRKFCRKDFLEEVTRWFGYGTVMSILSPVYSKFKLLGIRPNDKLVIKWWKVFLQSTGDVIGMMWVDFLVDKGFGKEYELSAQQFMELYLFSFLSRGMWAKFDRKFKVIDKNEKYDWLKYIKVKNEASNVGNTNKIWFKDKLIWIKKKLFERKKLSKKEVEQLKNELEDLNKKWKDKMEERKQLKDIVKELEKQKLILENDIKVYKNLLNKIENKEITQNIAKDLENKGIVSSADEILNWKNQLNIIKDLEKEISYDIIKYWRYDKIDDNLIKKLESIWLKQEVEGLKLWIGNKVDKTILESKLNGILWQLWIKISNIENKLDQIKQKLDDELKKKDNELKNIEDDISKLKTDLKVKIKEAKDIKKEIDNFAQVFADVRKVKFKWELELEYNGKRYVFKEWEKLKINNEDYVLLKKENDYFVYNPNAQKVEKLEIFVLKHQDEIQKYLENIINSPSFRQRLWEKIKSKRPNLSKEKIYEMLKNKDNWKNIGCILIFGTNCEKIPNWKSAMKEFLKNTFVNSSVLFIFDIIQWDTQDVGWGYVLKTALEVWWLNIINSFSNRFLSWLALAAWSAGEWFIEKKDYDESLQEIQLN